MGDKKVSDEKKTTLVLFAYSDGSCEYAVGDHSQEVMEWLNSCQGMQFAHGGQYMGRKMIKIPAAGKDNKCVEVKSMESFGDIAKEVFPDLIAELNKRKEGQA